MNPDPTPAQPETESNQKAKEKLIGELAAEKDRYLRLAADFDNFRRRTAQEMERRFLDANHVTTTIEGGAISGGSGDELKAIEDKHAIASDAKLETISDRHSAGRRLTGIERAISC